MNMHGYTENVYVEIQMVDDLVEHWPLEIQRKQIWRGGNLKNRR